MGADHGPARQTGRPAPSILGTVSVHRVHFARFPAFELCGAGGLTVEMGRYSALNIYFGWGQRLVLPTGPTWRVIAVQKGPLLHPVVLNETRQRLAMASAGLGNYGINGRDYAYTLNPAEAARFGRSGRWDLFRGEDRVASFTRRPFGADCEQPLPLPAVLLALLLTRLSIPGEADMQLPQMRWG